ncbi:glycosyltransferase family 2 protein [Petroclostridium xylanilyticum]|jgi:hypothetical protein|uniref:glycosyltransferase family 2 protein n=1 Tax=Petroclostridium xylanilyticum TaxID=1792311 RepID=UPI000B981331|nr:glycosyltransferase family 2 protein [Petroclostridium xylanilyticum]
MKKTLDIIIVNWNAGKQLYDCLESIQNTNKESFKLNKVIVVDNASTDDSLKNLLKLDIPLEIIRNKSNLGFATACNQGAKLSNSDFILFLNPDTILYEESLNIPMKFMQDDKNTDVGICGIQLIDEFGKVTRTCSRFPRTKYFISKMFLINKLFPNLNHHMLEWDHKKNLEVDQVIGAFFLIRRSLFEILGGFDERFFVYFEEVDLSYRVKEIGFKSMYLANVQAFHKGGGTSEQVKATRLFYSIRSRILYGFKHFSLGSAIILFLATLFIEPMSRIGLGIMRLSLKDIREVIKAYRMLIKDIPNIVRMII